MALDTAKQKELQELGLGKPAVLPGDFRVLRGGPSLASKIY